MIEKKKININPHSISISQSEKLAFISNLGTMLRAGISILEVIDSLCEDARGNYLLMMTKLKEDLEQGRQVHESLGQFDRVFDKVSINILKAAEGSGTLDTVLADIRNNMIKDAEFKDKIVGAAIYPVFIVIVFSLVLVGMLYGIVPKIGGVFLSLNLALPLPTRILLAMSGVLTNYTMQVVGVFATITALLIWLFKTKKNMVLNVFFRFPVVTGLVRDIDLTRFTRSMALLLASGLPITTALELARDVVLKDQVRLAITAGLDAILQGGRLSQGFEKHGKTFPTLLKKMIEVGEKSGSLEKSMQEASEFLDYETSKKIKTVTTLIEPVLLIGVAGLVGGMMMSIIAPIYGLIGSIGGAR